MPCSNSPHLTFTVSKHRSHSSPLQSRKHRSHSSPLQSPSTALTPHLYSLQAPLSLLTFTVSKHRSHSSPLQSPSTALTPHLYSPQALTPPFDTLVVPRLGTPSTPLWLAPPPSPPFPPFPPPFPPLSPSSPFPPPFPLQYASHSKKRPHNLVIGRMFDFHLYDMVELGVERMKSIKDLKGAASTTPRYAV